MSEKILIVDDSKSVRFLLGSILNKNNIEPVEAADGEEGLEKALKLQEEILMLFMDLSMPKMDGLEVLKSLTKENFSKPIVMLTTTQTSKLIEEARQMGASGWIVKPFKYDDIVETIQRLTGRVMKTAAQIKQEKNLSTQ